MKREDIDFRKNCQSWHLEIRRLLKRGEVDLACKLRERIAISLKKWEEQERSIRFRTKFLKSLLTTVTLEEKIKRASLNK